jgi:hypothetical protein
VSLVAIVARDLIIATRISEAARAAGHDVVRVDDPQHLPAPAEVDLAFVDWSSRGGDWATALSEWSAAAAPGGAPRFVLFGSHLDLEAHAAARNAGLGPMRARSKLVAGLPALLGAALGERDAE